jgi:hypothetical protein
LGPVGPVYASPSAVIQLITPEQVYANGLTCPEFQQMNLTTPNAVVNDTGCCDAFAYCLDNAQCSSLMTLFQVALIAVLVYCASKYAEAQSRSVFAGGEWLPGIIVPAMFTFFLYVVSLSVHAGSLGCCICCFGRTASLTLVQTGPGGNAIGNPTRANQVPNAIVGSGPRRHGCCEIPSALISSVFTEPATETAAVAHFDKMRTAPMRLLIKVRCGHWVRRGKHSHFVVTYTYVMPRSTCSNHTVRHLECCPITRLSFRHLLLFFVFFLTRSLASPRVRFSQRRDSVLDHCCARLLQHSRPGLRRPARGFG